MVEVKTKLYKFSELSEDVQKKVVEKAREEASEHVHYDFVYEDAQRMGAMLGITIDDRQWTNSHGYNGSTPKIWWSGFWSQGDGACFDGSYEYVKGASKAIRAECNDEKLIRFADELQALQKPFLYGLRATCTHSGHYYHSGCMRVEVTHKQEDGDHWRAWENRSLPEDELTEILRDFANWIYRQLEAEYDYQTSEEAVRESLLMNDDEERYEEDGDIF